MTTDDNKLTRQVAIRLSDDDMTRLDALSPGPSHHSHNAIARAALRLGIATSGRSSRLFAAPETKTRRRACRMPTDLRRALSLSQKENQ